VISGSSPGRRSHEALALRRRLSSISPAFRRLVALADEPARGLSRSTQCARQTGVWVPETLHRSRHLLIFVDQSTEAVTASDVVRLACPGVVEGS
jgi:hypothetical protein